MTTSLIKFNLDMDKMNGNPTTIYTHEGYSKQEINDAMGFNYHGGFINFVNTNFINTSDGNAFLQWPEAYLNIPYSVTCELKNKTGAELNDFKFKTDDKYKYAISMKPFHHVIDRCDIKMGRAGNVVKQFNYTNLYINERLKTMNEDEYQVVGDLINYKLDNPETLEYAQSVGESNNDIHIGTFTRTTKDRTNYGFYERCLKNVEMIGDANRDSALNNYKIPGNELKEAGFSGVGQITDTQLVYNGTIILPLKYVHSFFDSLPTTKEMQGFEMKLFTNLDNNNVYTVSHSGALAVTGVTCTQANAFTCPFMIGKVGLDGTASSAFPVVNGTTANKRDTGFDLEFRTRIGWSTINGDKFVRDTASPACKIVIPMVKLNPTIAEQIVKVPMHVHRYRDIHIEIDSDINARSLGSTVRRAINSNIGLARTLYIIPFLSPSTTFTATVNGNNVQIPLGVSPLLSPLSSAPTTCSPVLLKDFQVKIGSATLFQVNLMTNSDLYKDYLMSLYSHVNGNSLQSLDYGTRITFDKWVKGGYRVYAVDLKRILTKNADLSAKTIDIQFKIHGPETASIKYDFMYIIDSESQIFLDRISGVAKQTLDPEM
ncbi:MAG: hypothetical protein K2P99_05040 [Burkholderiales bacterium]|nr:hypothetical protein [Burkholderiales bacterium]